MLLPPTPKSRRFNLKLPSNKYPPFFAVALKGNLISFVTPLIVTWPNRYKKSLLFDLAIFVDLKDILGYFFTSKYSDLRRWLSLDSISVLTVFASTLTSKEAVVKL